MPTDLAPRDASAALAFAASWRIVVGAYLDATTDSPLARGAYRRHLQAAFLWLDVPAVADLTGARLAACRAQLTGNGLAPAWQSQALAALRAFLAWSGTMGAHRLPGDVVWAALKTPRGSVTKPYARRPAPSITASSARSRGVVTASRKAAPSGLLKTWAEAVGLDVGDMLADQEGGAALHVRHGKGRKDRIVPIQGDVARALRASLAATGRRLGQEGPLFRAHDRAAQKLPRGRLTTRAAGYVVARCVTVAGVDAKRVSPHSLRHTFAIRSLRQRRDVIAVQKLLGHASVATTQRYLEHLDLAVLRRAVPDLPVAKTTTP